MNRCKYECLRYAIMTFHNLKMITVILQNIELIPQLHSISVTYVILECPHTITTDTKLKKNNKNILKTSSHVTAIGRHIVQKM